MKSFKTSLFVKSVPHLCLPVIPSLNPSKCRDQLQGTRTDHKLLHLYETVQYTTKWNGDPYHITTCFSFTNYTDKIWCINNPKRRILSLYSIIQGCNRYYLVKKSGMRFWKMCSSQLLQQIHVWSGLLYAVLYWLCLPATGFFFIIYLDYCWTQCLLCELWIRLRSSSKVNLPLATCYGSECWLTLGHILRNKW